MKKLRILTIVVITLLFCFIGGCKNPLENRFRVVVDPHSNTTSESVLSEYKVSADSSIMPYLSVTKNSAFHIRDTVEEYYTPITDSFIDISIDTAKRKSLEDAGVENTVGELDFGKTPDYVMSYDSGTDESSFYPFYNDGENTAITVSIDTQADTTLLPVFVDNAAVQEEYIPAPNLRSMRN